MFFFQFPFSDWWLNRGGVKFLWRTWDKDIHHHPERLNAAEQTIRKHKSNARSYYWMGNLYSSFKEDVFKKQPQMLVPTLTLYGSRDRCFLPDTVRLQTDSRRFAKGHRIKEIVDGGHFLHHTKPDLVNKELRRWITTDHKTRA